MPILSAKFLRIQSRRSFDSHSNCASSSRSSCSRSSNRSDRKSLPSQVKSNAKKQGETVTAIIKATEVMIQTDSGMFAETKNSTKFNLKTMTAELIFRARSEERRVGKE